MGVKQYGSTCPVHKHSREGIKESDTADARVARDLIFQPFDLRLELLKLLRDLKSDNLWILAVADETTAVARAVLVVELDPLIDILNVWIIDQEPSRDRAIRERAVRRLRDVLKLGDREKDRVGDLDLIRLRDHLAHERIQVPDHVERRRGRPVA